MAEDIVVRYRAEVDDLLRKLDQISDAQKEVIKGEKAANDEAKKSTTSQEFAAKKRAQLLELEKKRLLELQKAQKLAFDPKQIDAYNKKINESNRNIELLTDNTKKQTSVAGGALKSFALGAGAALAAAFSVDAIIQFGKATITAFLDAEKNAERLRFAITSIGGESEAAFDRLIKQSEELQKITVFDDDSIQQAQAALSAFGLTANEIERTIPLLADFATVTGTDIAQAAQQLGAGLEGAGREFKKYGIEVSATATRQQNLNAILGGFSTFAGSAEAATKTLTGQLQQQANAVGELQESIGEKLAPAFVRARKAVFEFVQTLLLIPADQARKATENQREELQRQNIDFAIATTQRIQNLDKLAAAQQVLADKQELLSNAQTNRRTDIPLGDAIAESQRSVTLLNQQIELINEIIKAEEQRIKLESDKKAAASNEQELKRLEELKKLREKQEEERSKQRQQFIDFLAATEFGLTELERGELEKRDAAYLDSLEKQRLAKQKIVDEEQARAKQALEISLNNEIEALLKEELSIRQAYAKTFEELELSDLKVKEGAIRAEFGFTVDANNKIIILQQETTDKIKQLYQSLGLVYKQVNAKRVEDEKLTASQILNETSNLVNQVAGIYNNLTNQRLEEIDRVKEAEFEALDAQLQANQDALNRRQISEQDFENNRNKLLQQRQAAEAAAARKERELKRKQAQLNKAASIAQATINIAEAVTKALTAGPVVGQVLAALTAALGAVELGIIASTPIPYAKGTKKAKKGLARVGEEGEEIMYVPQGAKVLPNKQTNRYGEVLDAMFDNKFDQLYIKRKDIAPQLIRQKQIREVNTQKSFAENIAQSAMVNPATGLTYFDMRQALGKGTSINGISPEAADAIGKAFARHIQSNPYRQ